MTEEPAPTADVDARVASVAAGSDLTIIGDALVATRSDILDRWLAAARKAALPSRAAGQRDRRPHPGPVRCHRVRPARTARGARPPPRSRTRVSRRRRPPTHRCDSSRASVRSPWSPSSGSCDRRSAGRSRRCSRMPRRPRTSWPGWPIVGDALDGAAAIGLDVAVRPDRDPARVVPRDDRPRHPPADHARRGVAAACRAMASRVTGRHRPSDRIGRGRPRGERRARSDDRHAQRRLAGRDGCPGARSGTGKPGDHRSRSRRRLRRDGPGTRHARGAVGPPPHRPLGPAAPAAGRFEPRRQCAEVLARGGSCPCQRRAGAGRVRAAHRP